MGSPVETIESLDNRITRLEELMAQIPQEVFSQQSVRLNKGSGQEISQKPPVGNPLSDVLISLAGNIQRLADHFAPSPSDIVGSRYIADRLGQTTTWVAEMARKGTIPKGCLVPGTGSGKVWKFYRSKIEDWLKKR